MVAGERELYERFVDYDDEELLRILTAERRKYRHEALAAAELVLMQRGVAPPPALPVNTEPPPATQRPRRARSKSPYQFIDLCVDAILFGSLYWVTGALGDGTLLPGAWLLDAATRLLLSASVTVAVMYLRHGWRTKEWKD